jgi:hypothetical protein
MSKDVKIACPKCNWEPDGGAYWSCTCGHIWNTFETAGQCPSCGRQWTHTQCIGYRGGCNRWSPHIDWYRDLDDWVEEEIQHIVEIEQG